jgi:hypothetical protein
MEAVLVRGGAGFGVIRQRWKSYGQKYFIWRGIAQGVKIWGKKAIDEESP